MRYRPLTIRLARRAIRNYPHHPLAESRAQVVNLRVKWLEAIERLGDRWVLAVPVQRKEPFNG